MKKCAGHLRCNVRHDARGVNYFGRRTMLHLGLEPTKMNDYHDYYLTTLPDRLCAREKCVRQGVLKTPPVTCKEIAISCKRKCSHQELKNLMLIP